MAADETETEKADVGWRGACSYAPADLPAAAEEDEGDESEVVAGSPSRGAHMAADETETEKADVGWRGALVPIAPADLPAAAEEDEGDESEVVADDADGEDADASVERGVTEIDEDETELADGVPDDPSAYELPTIEGHKWTAADAEALESFFETAHAAGIPQEGVTALTQWYVGRLTEVQTAETAALKARDKTDKQSTVQALKAQLGEQFKPSIQLLDRLLRDTKAVGKGGGEQIVSARGNDGGLLINNPLIAQLLIGAARARYSAPATGKADKIASIEARITELDDLLRNDPSRYWSSGGSDERLALARKLQQRNAK